ncbi:hypothetical protein ACFY0A_17760 [Streptomyces sp. NPDC001698]|uniref:hypothetical protein n=1 Tax=Streptomyces sp. NPDC001698 TaxID=3364601 RepID=UPI00368FCD88
MSDITADDVAHAAAVSGLPPAIVRQLVGETRSELEANARTVAAAMGMPEAPQ